MRIFVDTSVLVKRYIKEAGTEKVADVFEQATQIVVSLTAMPEAVSALRRVYQENKITLAQYKERKKELLIDFQDFEVCDLTPDVVHRTIDVIERFSLRTLDAIHLACALAADIDHFVSSDAQQLKAAHKAKLKIMAIN